MSAHQFTFIDLFCGCGGFALGLQQAGFRCVAAIDSNPEAISVFRANFPRVPHVLQKDLTRFRPEQLAALLANRRVDVVIGGPPCQGFSVVRQVDSANHGPRVRRDKRRYYYREFLRYVDFFQARLFVMENVPGMRSAAKGRFFTSIQAEARKLGYRIQSQLEEAWHLGVPQKRRRQLIIGVHSDYAGYFPSRLQPANGELISKDPPTLWDAIGDLPRVTAGCGSEKRQYDLRRRARATFRPARGMDR